MKAAIRADASVAIGSGHIMRCLTLAEALRSQGAEVFFICREAPGSCSEILTGKGFLLLGLPGDGEFNSSTDSALTAAVVDTYKPDWLVIDHYGIGMEWERRLRQNVKKIMVIDDLADRHHDCDLLLDQNLTVGMNCRYDNHVPKGCRQFIGPKYLLLRNEFIEARSRLRNRDGVVRRILIFFGGSDPGNETGKTLRALRLLNREQIAVDVVVGGSNPHAPEIKAMCAEIPNVYFHCQVDNMSELMAMADLAIGAGGSATWERCFMGLPSLIVVVADNQSAPAEAVATADLARFLGNAQDLSESSLSQALSRAIDSPHELNLITQKCLTMFGARDSTVHRDIMNCIFGGNDAS